MQRAESFGAQSSTSGSKQFVDKLATDYPDFSFKTGTEEHWSPNNKTITYNPDEPQQKLRYGLLHELAHALLGHQTYQNDFELLRLEAQAWELASKLGKKYGVDITDDHIQNCLDTYRDWLHKRSRCPKCGAHSLQKDSKSYYCFNCRTTWRVNDEEFVRPYRKTLKLK